MKCHSVACLWSAAPPLHKVTATAVLSDPPTLYTGGSDGSIIWWNFSTHQSRLEVWPMAMLCGHATAIADLSTCTPAVGSSSDSNVSSTLPPAGSDALLSACTDGVLCVWSRGSGHCRRRRKLPPWAGTPSLLSPLPSSPRFVCVACSCAESSGHTEAAAEGQDRRTSKWAAVIVDSCTLNILQTVFHGVLSIGPLKCMSVVPDLEDGKKNVVVVADAIGKVQMMAVPAESDQDGEGGSGMHRSSSVSSVISISGESSSDAFNAVSVVIHGSFLVLVFATQCVFKSVASGAVVGEISLASSPLCSGDSSSQPHLVGAMFLQRKKGDSELEAQDSEEGFVDFFAVWSTNGAVRMYKITATAVNFNFEPVCEIPAISHPFDHKTSVTLCQLNCYFIRVQSVHVDVGNSALWKPHVTVWSISQPSALLPDSHAELGRQWEPSTNSRSDHPYISVAVGEGCFPDDWVGSWTSLVKAEELSYQGSPNKRVEGSMKGFQQSYAAESVISKFQHGEYISNPMLTERIVSSSMVLSEDFYAPYAVVYGFSSGEIELIRFGNTFPDTDSTDGIAHPQTNLHMYEQSYLGHMGAVLCLAAHHMAVSSNEHSLLHVLISGSLDCTVRIWDMDTANPVSVMHHHVAPIRQIILPPPWTDHPWSDCFLSVGEDSCVALASLGTLRMERMFPGHPCYPSMVAWDGARGYIACLCRNLLSPSYAVTLYIWDVKTGARERILRGTASYSMFDHFCRGININTITGNILGGTTSASSLLLPIIEDSSIPKSHKGMLCTSSTNLMELNSYLAHGSNVKEPLLNAAHDFNYSAVGISSTSHASTRAPHQNKKHPIKSSCPFPGIAALEFDLSSLMFPCQTNRQYVCTGNKMNAITSDQETKRSPSQYEASNNSSDVERPDSHPIKESVEAFLLRFSLSFLHLWDVDHELDKLLMDEMKICRPEGIFLTSGVPGDRGSLALMFPGLHTTLELWKCSSEFSAMRSLTIVSLAQRMISLSHPSSAASSALAAFYTRNLAEKIADIRPPSLQLLVSFWQDPSEHVRMAARSLFHCAAPRAIPRTLCCQKTIRPAASSTVGDVIKEHPIPDESEMATKLTLDSDKSDQFEESGIVAWLEAFDMQDWVSCIWGTTQDAMASHIIVASALAVWYPSLVKEKLARLVVNHLIKLVMAVNDQYSSTAAELLAEGMDNTWKTCIGAEIPHLIGDLFFQIECLSSGTANTAVQNPAVAANIRETLVGILLPSLAMADISGFLSVIESQIWATSSDSPVHLVSLNTLIRVVRGSPKPLAPYLDKVVNFVLQTLDHGNTVMRKVCLNSSMAMLREVARVFPMVALNEATSRLAVGDAIGDICSVSIRVYDIQSVTKIKVLDASGPLGLPSLLSGVPDKMVTAAISALSFSPDGEGLVAFSEHGLMIRWWSLGTLWWEKLSRSTVPVQCTKLIFVPPWEGFSPNSSRSSIMASIIGPDNWASSQEKTRELSDADNLKLLLHNLDLSYRLEWAAARQVVARQVVLTRHGQQLGTFQL